MLMQVRVYSLLKTFLVSEIHGQRGFQYLDTRYLDRRYRLALNQYVGDEINAFLSVSPLEIWHVIAISSKLLSQPVACV